MTAPTLIVIPARLESTRLPRKVLLKESGKYLIQHVFEQVQKIKNPAHVVIATDHKDVVEAAKSFGASARLTKVDHKSGTDRVCEVVHQLHREGLQYELIVNVQGDEPEIEPSSIDALIDLMNATSSPISGKYSRTPIGTLAEPCNPDDILKPQVVKVVLNRRGEALYFSRSPYSDPQALKHIGIYAYRPATLYMLTTEAPCSLEEAEKLEQLRALYYGYTIRVGKVPPSKSRGIDTREDYDAFLKRLGIDTRTPAERYGVTIRWI